MGIRKRRVPNRLRVVRAERHITQFALAYKSRVSPSRISMFENGHLEPTSDEKDRLARALKTDVAIVFPVPDVEAVAS